jgi:hypothetical protein
VAVAGGAGEQHGAAGVRVVHDYELDFSLEPRFQAVWNEPKLK